MAEVLHTDTETDTITIEARIKSIEEDLRFLTQHLDLTPNYEKELEFIASKSHALFDHARISREFRERERYELGTG